ncbi:MAG: sugar phosphate isomerase/epimerase, partial [Burkholderiales bacterium]|nr:sugar phosphate isomerase/epimerase [Phycisphaerae bacterium]
MNAFTPKLAFSTNAFTGYTLPEAISAIADAGFGAVEILADVPHAFVGTTTAADLSELRQLLASRKLEISNINANCTFGYWRHAPPEPYFEPSLISPVQKYREDRTRMICRTLSMARELGAHNISITSGRCLAHVTPDAAAGLLTESLKSILEEADRLNIDVGIELEPGIYLEFVHELRDWIGRLNHPRFGANLDIGHAVVNGERIDESVFTLAGRIWNMHIEDLPGRKHYHMIPGEGTFDWPQLMRSLAAINYDRFVTAELYT